MRNQRERGSRRQRNAQLPPTQAPTYHTPLPPSLDDIPTTRYSAPTQDGPAGFADAFADDALPQLTDPSDMPMTAPTQIAPLSASAPGRTSQSGMRQSQALVPLKTGAERDRALAAVNAASESATTVIPGARRYRPPAVTVVPRRSGPRSAITQFAVSMVVTAMLISALTLSTPLGQAAALDVNSPMRAYANAAPWIPTPTPTPKPKPTPSFRPPAGANPGQQAVINDISYVFGSYASSALAVARCESGYNPNAWNSYPILNSHASGVFQILYPSTWNTTSYASSSPFNADANIHAAYEIFRRDGYSWREWQCQP